MNYYNEFDPKAAAWLRELILQGLIPDGIVDERSITEISPNDLSEYTQCHFFAGIGGWSLALELAGWPATRPVWTGSCPCQPFSSAGKQKAQSDARHLWPAFFSLIRECRPVHVFGEQVASAIGHGWLDGISEDLESEGYACGAAVLGAHSVSAPHIRQRLYWMAISNGQQELAANPIRLHAESGSGGTHGGVADAAGGQREQCLRPQGDELQRPSDNGTDGGMGVTNGAGWDEGQHAPEGPRHGHSAESASDDGGMEVACDNRAGGVVGKTCGLGRETVDAGAESIRQAYGATSTSGTNSRSSSSNGLGDTASGGCGVVRDASQPGGCGHTISPGWSRFEIVHCRDGKARRFEPGSFPLADGIPGRVGLLRGYGNAIVPQVAAEFIAAFLDISPQNIKP